MEEQIKVAHVYKSYNEKAVLRDLTFTIPTGEWTVLMGESGCGKTTLLRILMGLEKADAGEVVGLPDKISAVFQENRLCMEASGLENVTLVMNGSKKENRDRAEQLLTDLGLADCMEQQVREYSGGMQRRVAIARALAAENELLLLDEPFKGLDDKTKELVLDLVKKETAGKTVLLVTHDQEEAKLGHCILLDGQI